MEKQKEPTAFEQNAGRVSGLDVKETITGENYGYRETRELVQLVKDAADLIRIKDKNAFTEFNTIGTKWRQDETYIFILDLQGNMLVHPDKDLVGKNQTDLVDVNGKFIIGGIIDTVTYDPHKPFGWYHYQWQVPGEVVPRWKSTYVQLVTTNEGGKYIVGCGIYNMKMEKVFIEDLVNRAASLISEKGKNAFPAFRDKTGPYMFLDTYVFVQTPEGIELVNPAQPTLEGKNIIELKDLRGREMVREEITAAMEKGSAWLECYWYRPIDNKPALKQTFVRKVVYGNEVYIIGSGVYGIDMPVYRSNNSFRKVSWINVKHEELTDKLTRQMISGEKATISKFSAKKGASVMRHYHDSEEFFYLNSGSAKFIFDNEEIVLKAGEMMLIPQNLPHEISVLEDAEIIDFFASVREDWMKGEDLYLRKQQKVEVSEPMFDPLIA